MVKNQNWTKSTSRWHMRKKSRARQTIYLLATANVCTNLTIMKWSTDQPPIITISGASRAWGKNTHVLFKLPINISTKTYCCGEGIFASQQHSLPSNWKEMMVQLTHRLHTTCKPSFGLKKRDHFKLLNHLFFVLINSSVADFESGHWVCADTLPSSALSWCYLIFHFISPI